MKAFNIKQIMKESKLGSENIANSKLCWELTDNSRAMLEQEIYHLVMKTTLNALDNHIENHIIMTGGKKRIIIDKR